MDAQNDLRSRLVQEAMRLLADHPEAVTLRGVARAAGVSAMAPYRHFADKAALLRAVTDSGFGMLRDTLLAADRAKTERDALIGQGLAYIDFAVAHPGLFRLMFAAPEGAGIVKHPGDDTAYGVLARRLATMIPGHAETSVIAAWAIVHGLATLTLDARLPPDPAHPRAVLTLFVDGLMRSRPTVPGQYQ